MPNDTETIEDTLLEKVSVSRRFSCYSASPVTPATPATPAAHPLWQLLLLPSRRALFQLPRRSSRFNVFNVSTTATGGRRDVTRVTFTIKVYFEYVAVFCGASDASWRRALKVGVAFWIFSCCCYFALAGDHLVFRTVPSVRWRDGGLALRRLVAPRRIVGRSPGETVRVIACAHPSDGVGVGGATGNNSTAPA